MNSNKKANFNHNEVNLVKNVKKILLFALPTVVLVFSLLYLINNNKNIRVFYYEYTYNKNATSTNLSKLCYNLKFTDMHKKKIEYYPNLLFNNEAFKNFGKTLNENSNLDNVFDQLQTDYIFSFFHLKRYEQFEENFVEFFPKSKTLGYKYELIALKIYDNKITKDQLKVILNALINSYNNLDDNHLEQIGNLNAQYWIYDKLDDDKNRELVESKSLEILSSIK